MTSFMMPHVYGRIMPEHLTIVQSSSKPVINETLAHYLSIAHKAIEQYVEIWENMSKITNLYDNLGDHPRSYYEMLEILNVYKLDETATAVYLSVTLSVISIVCNMKKGENCVIKTADMFSQESVDRMYILSMCFNEVYLYKPASTPAITSDKYIICKDFKMISTQHLNHLTDCFIYSRRINCTYINALIEANSVIGQQQLEAINNTITLIEQGKKKEKIEALKRQQAAKCAEWNKKFGVTFKSRLCDVGGI